MEFHHFSETAVNSLIEKAPLLKEITLSGLALTEKYDDAETLTMECRNIRLVNIERVIDLKKIEIKNF